MIKTTEMMLEGLKEYSNPAAKLFRQDLRSCGKKIIFIVSQNPKRSCATNCTKCKETGFIIAEDEKMNTANEECRSIIH